MSKITARTEKTLHLEIEGEYALLILQALSNLMEAAPRMKPEDYEFLVNNHDIDRLVVLKAELHNALR